MPPIFAWTDLLGASILILVIFLPIYIYNWRDKRRAAKNKVTIRELTVKDKNYMKTTVTTNTHNITFKTMDEVKELHRLLGNTLRAWELSGVSEMGPVKSIVRKDPILDETV